MVESLKLKNQLKIESMKGEEEGFKLVSIGEDYPGRSTPHCSKHGAMNKLTDTIWRCLSEYGYKDQPGESMPKFMDRTCLANCQETANNEETN